MKTAKKITALLIVLTLLFALSATAFATNTYTIKFFVNGSEQTTWQLTGTVGNSVYTTIHNSNLTDVFYDVQDYYNPSVYHKALNSLQGYATTPGTASDVPSTYTNFTAVPNHPGYFYIGLEDDGYHYIYVGHDWTYCYQGGGNIWDYMDSCYPTTESVIIVTYSLQVSEWWADEPIT